MASPGYRPNKIRFGIFEIDVADRTLRKRGEAVKLQPQQFDVLLILVEHAGRVVSREEIRETVWERDTFVDFQRSINFAINQIRAALNDSPERPSFIETVPKHGYRFIAKVESDGRNAHALSSGPILIDSKPADARPQPDPVKAESEEFTARIQTAAETKPVQSARSRTTALTVITTGAVIGALAITWWWMRRPAPLEIKETQLTHNSNDNPISSVSISPDGKYFAYSDLGGLHVKLLETGEIHDFPQPTELGQSRARWVLSWLPDSAHFLATAWGVGVPRSTWKASVLSQSSNSCGRILSHGRFLLTVRSSRSPIQTKMKYGSPASEAAPREKLPMPEQATGSPMSSGLPMDRTCSTSKGYRRTTKSRTS